MEAACSSAAEPPHRRIVIYSSDLEDELQQSPVKVDGGPRVHAAQSPAALPDDLATLVADADPFNGLNADDSNGAWMHNIDLSNCIRLTHDEHTALVGGHGVPPAADAADGSPLECHPQEGTAVPTTSAAVDTTTCSTSSAACTSTSSNTTTTTTARPTLSANTRIAADHSYVPSGEPQQQQAARPRPTLQRQTILLNQPGRLTLKPSAPPPQHQQQQRHSALPHVQTHVIRAHHGHEASTSTRDYRPLGHSLFPSSSSFGGGEFSHLTATPRGKVYQKPVYSYSCLIALSLKNSKNGRLTVAEIYAFMCENFPYFRTAPPGWKNSVRHNLSLNKCFEKIEIETPGGHGRKSCLWSMPQGKLAKMDLEIRKWRDKDADGVRESLLDADELEMIESGQKGMPSPAPGYYGPNSDYDGARPPYGAASGINRVASTGRVFNAGRAALMHNGGATRSSYSLHGNKSSAPHAANDDWGGGGAPAKMARMHRHVSAGTAAMRQQHGYDEGEQVGDEHEASLSLARHIAAGGPASVQHRLHLGAAAADARGRRTPPRMGPVMTQMMCGHSPGVYGPSGSPCYDQPNVQFVGGGPAFAFGGATPPYSPGGGGMMSPLKQSPVFVQHGTPTHAAHSAAAAAPLYQYSPFALHKLAPINIQWSPYDEAKRPAPQQHYQHVGGHPTDQQHQLHQQQHGGPYGGAEAAALSPDYKMFHRAYDTAQSAINNNTLLQSAHAFSPHRGAQAAQRQRQEHDAAPPPVPPRHHSVRPHMPHTSLLHSL